MKWRKLDSVEARSSYYLARAIFDTGIDGTSLVLGDLECMLRWLRLAIILYFTVEVSTDDLSCDIEAIALDLAHRREASPWHL